MSKRVCSQQPYSTPPNALDMQIGTMASSESSALIFLLQSYLGKKTSTKFSHGRLSELFDFLVPNLMSPKIKGKIMRSCGCPIRAGAQGQVRWDPGQPDPVGNNWPRAGGWSSIIFKVPSNPSHSIIPSGSGFGLWSQICKALGTHSNPP